MMRFEYIGQSGASAVFAEIRVKNVTGEVGVGFHRLFVNVEMFTRAAQSPLPVRLTELHGDVRVMVANQSPTLGRLLPRVLPIEIRLYDHPSTFSPQLELQVSSQQLHVLDELRAGLGLRFSISLRARVMVGDASYEPTGEETIDLNQGTCIELFRSMGFFDRLLLEVPAPSAVANPALAEAIENLRAAHAHLQHGRWRDAVGGCRDVLESLSRGLGDGDAADQLDVQGPLFHNTRAYTKTQRLQLVRRALKVLTHAARHSDEHTATIEWTAADARSTLSMVAALLAQIGA